MKSSAEHTESITTAQQHQQSTNANDATQLQQLLMNYARNQMQQLYPLMGFGLLNGGGDLLGQSVGFNSVANLAAASMAAQTPTPNNGNMANGNETLPTAMNPALLSQLLACMGNLVSKQMDPKKPSASDQLTANLGSALLSGISNNLAANLLSSLGGNNAGGVNVGATGATAAQLQSNLNLQNHSLANSEREAKRARLNGTSKRNCNSHNSRSNNENINQISNLIEQLRNKSHAFHANVDENDEDDFEEEEEEEEGEQHRLNLVKEETMNELSEMIKGHDDHRRVEEDEADDDEDEEEQDKMYSNRADNSLRQQNGTKTSKSGAISVPPVSSLL